MIVNKYVMLALIFLALELALIDNKDKIIPMIIIMGFASFFVNDEDSFYKWVSWCGTFVAISLLVLYILGGI